MTLDRFVLSENLRHLEAKLQVVDASALPTLKQMIVAAARELALFDAEGVGAGQRRGFGLGAPSDAARALAVASFRSEFAATPWPAALIDPRPGLIIADLNQAFAEAADRKAEEIVGKSFFALFPDNPADPAATGVANLYASLRKVVESGRDDAMDVQRYDTRDAADVWQERYWLPVNHAVTDEAGRILFILHTSREEKGPGANRPE